MPHSRGEPIKLRADLQNRLEDFALSQLTGAQNPDEGSPFDSAVIVKGLNTSADLINRDRVAHIGDLVLDPQTHKQSRRLPCIGMNAPTFPASLGRFAIALQPVAPARIGDFAIAGHCIASVFFVKSTDRFATIDPDDPTRLRSSDTGEVRIVALPASTPANTERLCFIRFGPSPVVRWRYKRDSDYQTPGPVSLLRIDGDEFADGATVQMLDDIALMDDQLVDDVGIMDQIGHQFLAVNAPCSSDSVSANYLP